MGATFKNVLTKVLSMESGSYIDEKTRKKSEKRLSKEAIANTDAAKKRRKMLKYKNTTKDQATYSTGTFFITTFVQNLKVVNT